MRALRNAIKRHFKRAFELGQRFGIDVLPRHFYSSIPDFRALRRDDHWRRPYEMVGVAGAAIDGQVEFLRSLMTQREAAAARRARLLHTLDDLWHRLDAIRSAPGDASSDVTREMLALCASVRDEVTAEPVAAASVGSA